MPPENRRHQPDFPGPNRMTHKTARNRLPRLSAYLLCAAMLAGCSSAPAPNSNPTSASSAASSASGTPPVVRHPLASASTGATAASSAPIVLPAGVQYVCVVDSNGQRKQTAIEFSGQVAALCRRHPEMGPCQYERDACRRKGGRVYTENNVEITLETEAEYDKRVLRVRFRAN